MKVVILAGGLGTRMREETEFRPKPMVDIGGKPVLWHIMKLFSHHGFNDFVILAGYRSDEIKRYFLEFRGISGDFELTLGEPDSIKFWGLTDELNWRVTVVDTGLETPTAGRILRARDHIGDQRFFCTYGDGIADVNLPALLDAHLNSGSLATLTSTRPQSRFGVLDVDSQSRVASFREKPLLDDLVNIGFFVFESSVFDFLQPGEALEEKPLGALSAARMLSAYEHKGFWQPMDTYREYLQLNELWSNGSPPWKVWDD